MEIAGIEQVLERGIFMKLSKFLLVTGLISCLTAFPSMAAYYCTSPGAEGNVLADGTFIDTEQGRHFTGADGQVYANHWLYYSGTRMWYYFNHDGYAVTGFQDIDGKRHYFDPQKAYMKKGFFVADGYLYCGDFDTGEILTSLNGGNNAKHGRDGVYYVFDSQGHATNPEGKWDSRTLKELGESKSGSQTWAQENRNWVYYENGQKLVNAWHLESDIWYYFDENGYMLKSCVREINGVRYSFDINGAMRTRGRIKDDQGVQYEVGADGVLTLVDTEAEKAAAEAKRKLANDYALNERQQSLNKSINPYNDNPTVQWFNATYAILTKGNGHNIRAVGGILKISSLGGIGPQADEDNQKMVQNLLVSYWGVTDRASADAVLNRLVASGNATGSAWDYSRAMSNLGYYYLAGYYTIEETLDRSLEIAQIIQTRFTSWAEFNESYLAGYASWSGNSDAERRAVYNGLKESAFNPYILDWNLTLTKSW